LAVRYQARGQLGGLVVRGQILTDGKALRLSGIDRFDCIGCGCPLPRGRSVVAHLAGMVRTSGREDVQPVQTSLNRCHG
jgi:hypothetical protein